MTSQEIVSQVIAIVPALLFTYLTIYSIYWLLGIIKWPNYSKREEWLAKFGSIDIKMLGGFRFSSLALISLISLFLELLLIRWITSEIRIFAYFKSLVLIACFLGFGLGAYLTHKKITLAYTLAPLLGMILLVELPWNGLRLLITNLSGFIGWFSDVHIWSRAYFTGNFVLGLGSAIIAMTIVIPLFGLIAITFVPVGQLVGWYLENSKKGILAYSINIVASIVGIWLFAGLSFLSTPPIVWFAVLGAALIIYFWFVPQIRRILFLFFAVFIVLFIIGTQGNQWWGEQSWKGSIPAEYQLEPGKIQTYWSPYQKLALIPLLKNGEIVRYILNTNDSWYQQIIDLSPGAVSKNPDLYATGIPVQYIQYNLPYQFFKNPPTVLIAGAGMGNDAASALRNGAGHVTAVEIDPLIYSLGKQLHFEDPYHSDKVDFHIDDARSFIQNTKSTYDLIVFSILDSHTTNSTYTNIRLDNYVYTVEAMQAVKKLLKPNGLFVLSFSSERPWFTTHLRDVVTKAFGTPPTMIQTNVSFFVVGNGDRVTQALAASPQLAQFVNSHSDMQLQEADLITDDWPYLYQQYRGIPEIVWLLSIGLIGICWLAFTKLKGSSEGIMWHFFFLGAAFTLLEVQIISKIALLFGTTWLVNAIVISVLLLFILLSNIVASLIPGLPRWIAYIGLFITMIFSYLVPTHSLFFDSLLMRGMVATALYCSPVFFAGLIFISSFKQIGFRAQAFGSNLLGSLVGGLLESLSFLTGIQSLVIVAALFYLASFVTLKQSSAVSIELDIDALPPR
jgi:SAM-dependent methyltransferase